MEIAHQEHQMLSYEFSEAEEVFTSLQSVLTTVNTQVVVQRHQIQDLMLENSDLIDQLESVIGVDIAEVEASNQAYRSYAEELEAEAVVINSEKMNQWRELQTSTATHHRLQSSLDKLQSADAKLTEMHAVYAPVTEIETNLQALEVPLKTKTCFFQSVVRQALPLDAVLRTLNAAVNFGEICDWRQATRRPVTLIRGLGQSVELTLDITSVSLGLFCQAHKALLTTNVVEVSTVCQLAHAVTGSTYRTVVSLLFAMVWRYVEDAAGALRQLS